MSRPKHMRWDTSVPAGRWNRLLKEDRRREAEQRDEDAEEMAEP